MGFNDMLMRARRRTANGQSGYGTVAGVQQAGDRQIAAQTEYGQDATDTYLNRAQNFDASAALNKYAQGAWGSISNALGQTLREQAGAAVGAGRFDSGYFDEDKGTVINRATSQFSNDIAQQSMAAASLDQRNTEGIGNFANERTEMGNELLAARSEQVQNDAREAAERKRRSRGGLLGGIGTAIGYGLGGPVGGYIGGAIGSYAGGR